MIIMNERPDYILSYEYALLNRDGIINGYLGNEGIASMAYPVYSP